MVIEELFFSFFFFFPQNDNVDANFCKVRLNDAYL
jgi:hypothetical protein